MTFLCGAKVGIAGRAGALELVGDLSNIRRPVSSPNSAQTFTFQNSYQATYGGNGPPTSSPRTTKRKRKVPANTESNSHRRLDNDPDTEAPAIFGVGTSTASADAASATSKNVFHPANIPGLNLGSRLTKSDKNAAGASDVWYFVCGTNTPDSDSLDPPADDGWETLGTSNKHTPARERETSSIPGFYNRLVKWIAVDDQSLDVVDCPELRDLLLFIGAQLDDGDIPHRTKLSQLISTRFHAEYTAMIHEIKISMITCDNAGNNGTMMEQIQHELALRIPFDSEGNRIRCFPHVINLAVKAGLKEVTELPDYKPDIVLDDFDIPVPQSLKDNLEYWDALKLDPVAAARKLVTACRASGQRRDTFEDTIEQDNAAGGFGDPPEISSGGIAERR
ncbi:hypothetical protein B0H14DRAFT_3778595 [Mycena olivaceomarginata]|nr:hypothetical protein B0H14DRAFT_3778595 [Mycena olivaceomarginata]